jgi:predicted ATP-grasp superfamily ATP-dependent carboligase
VTDGDNRATLAVTRSLGRRGHHVLVGDKHSGSLAHGSRYCAERVVYPDPSVESDAFVDEIARLVRTRSVDVLLPVADVTTFLIAAERHRFDCHVPLAELAAIERAADKVDITLTAERLGVPVPRGWVLPEREAIGTLDLEFPIVIKPWRSRVRTGDGWHALGVSYADNRDQLRQDLAARPDYAFPVLLQERIAGPGIGVFACYDRGLPVAMFSHRRVRERPPWGGVSVLSESIALDPAVEGYATRLLSEIGWQGPAMVEFKQDERDGVPKLMEINGRFWGSLQLAVDAGVDFPALILQAVQNVPFARQTPYKVGIRSRWLWGDFDSLLLTWRRRRHSSSPVSGSGRFESLGRFLRFWEPKLYYDNPKWDDPWPWVIETKARLLALGRLATGAPHRLHPVRMREP